MARGPHLRFLFLLGLTTISAWALAQNRSLPRPQPRPADAAAPDESATTLWVFLLDFDNRPVENVAVASAVAARQTHRARSGRDGGVLLRGSARGQIAHAWIEDPAWYSLDGPAEGEMGGTPLLIRIFPRNTSSTSREERIAILESKLRAAAQERERLRPPDDEGSATAGAGSGTVATTATLVARPAVSSAAPAASPLRPVFEDPFWSRPECLPMVALADGVRALLPEAPYQWDKPTTNPATPVEITVISDRGQPLPDVLVELLELDAPPSLFVRRVDHSRTDREGRALFDRLTAGQWYRAECATPENGLGRSTVFRGQAPPQRGGGAGGTDVVRPRPIVMRAPDHVVSGFALRASGPAAFARVELLDADTKPLLATVADEQGYFALGPIAKDAGDIEIIHTDSQLGSVDIILPRFDDIPELLIPLDAIK